MSDEDKVKEANERSWNEASHGSFKSANTRSDNPEKVKDLASESNTGAHPNPDVAKEEVKPEADKPKKAKKEDDLFNIFKGDSNV